MDCSTKANDLRLVVSLSTGKNRNVFRRIHIDFFARAASHLTAPPCFVTKAISNRFLALFHTIGEQAGVVYLTLASVRQRMA